MLWGCLQKGTFSAVRWASSIILLHPNNADAGAALLPAEKEGIIMTYTLHTWEIQQTKSGLVARNIAQRTTAVHAELIAMLKEIAGTGVQFLVTRLERPQQATGPRLKGGNGNV